MRGPVVFALAVVLGLSVVTAPASHAATERPVTERPASEKPATMVLNALPVSPERTAGYDREDFRHWVDDDGDGCDTREEVLIAERVAGRVIGCTVVGGRWRSAYDGIVTTNPSTFDIDHRVALGDAWASGAWRWTADTKERFANDLAFGPSLIAVSASSNRSKGDRDPAEWMPPQASQRCTYVKQWIAVKFRWGLAVDSAEKSALGRLLEGCPPLMRVPPRAPIRTAPM